MTLDEDVYDVLTHLDITKHKKFPTNLGFLVAKCIVIKVIDFKIKGF